MLFDELTEDNFLLFAAKYYDNPQCHGTEEFLDDLKRFIYLKRLFLKYEDSGELRERLILNHLIILYNLFGTQATKMIFFKLDEQHFVFLKPFLILLGYMPEVICKNNKFIQNSDIPLDQQIVQTLRMI